MLSAVNVPQSKSVSIAFISLKAMIFGIITTVIASQISEGSEIEHCAQDIMSFITVLRIFFILGAIVDAFALAYFFFSKEFRKVQYYIFYIFHIIVGLIAIVGGIVNSLHSSGCGVSEALLSSIVTSSVLFQFNTLVAMIGHLYMILKYLHCGSNLAWTIIWLTGLECDNVAVALIALIHGSLSIINMMSLIGIKIYGKTSGVVGFWKKLTFISLIFMIFCYLIVLVGLVSGTNCQQIKFFEKVYESYGFFEIISPALVLCFVRGQWGDPRQGKIKNHNEVFSKLQQNEFADFSSKI